MEEFFFNSLSQSELKDDYGTIADHTKVIEINPKYADAYNNRGIAKSNLGDKLGDCKDYKKAISIGSKSTEEWFATEGGAWCRNM